MIRIIALELDRLVRVFASSFIRWMGTVWIALSPITALSAFPEFR